MKRNLVTLISVTLSVCFLLYAFAIRTQSDQNQRDNLMILNKSRAETNMYMAKSKMNETRATEAEQKIKELEVKLIECKRNQ